MSGPTIKVRRNKARDVSGARAALWGEPQNMTDRTVSASSLIAYATWGLALGVWGVSFGLGLSGLGQLAIMIALAATTATVRVYFIHQSKRMKAATQLLVECSRNAESSTVHALHR